jgi:hypothetical protein
MTLEVKTEDLELSCKVGAYVVVNDDYKDWEDCCPILRRKLETFRLKLMPSLTHVPSLLFINEITHHCIFY